MQSTTRHERIRASAAAPATAADCAPRHVRWAPFIWSGAVTALVAVALAGAPEPALSGDGLLVSLGVLVVLGAGLFELRSHREPVPRAETLAVAGLGFALMAFADGAGTALIGAYAAVAALAHTREAPRAAVAAAPIALSINGALAVGDAGAAGFAWANWGLLSSFVLGVLIRGGRLRHREAAELLEQARQTRAAQAEAAMLAERGRIARELHDVLAHSLSGLAVQLQGAQLLAASSGADPELVDAIDGARRQARDGLVDARSAIEALRGTDLPGPDRLEELTRALSAERGIPCTLEVTGEPRVLPPQQRLALFRVGQEALTNVRRHARPDRVAVHLAYERDGTSLSVEDRSGERELTSAGPTRAGHGITGMSERAELLGGTLEADATDTGFRVRLWLPHRQTATSAPW